MNPADQLLTLADVSVALAGFVGIILTFQIRQQKYISRGRAVSLTLIVFVSLAAAFCTVLPVALMNFGVEDKNIWPISCIVGAAFWLTGLIFTMRNMKLEEDGPTSRIIFRALLFIVAAFIVVLLMNAVGIVFKQEYGPYFAAFIFGFGLVLYDFSRLLLHPIWKIIRKREETGNVAA